jgi:hypothetical protein
MFTVAPGLFAQQRDDALQRARPITDSASGTALFPLSVAQVTGEPTAPDRYRILTHEIDSISTLAGRARTPSTLHDEIATTSGRLMLVSQLAHDFGSSAGPPVGLARPRAIYGTMDWVNFVTLAGVAGLGRSSLFSSDASDQTVWGSLRNAGQWAGMATAAGGASWLLSNFTRHSACFGRLACHRAPVERLNR